MITNLLKVYGNALVKWKIVLVCLIGGGGLMVSSPLMAEEQLLEKIYYYVNDDIITKLDFEEAYILARQDVTLKNLEDRTLSNTVISNLITERAINYHADLAGIRIREGDYEGEVNRLMKQYNIQEREQFNLMLSAQGITQSVFERQIRRNLLIQRYVSRKISIDPPTDSEVLAYYNENRETDFKIENPIYYLAWVFLKNSSRKTFSERKKIQTQVESIRNEVLENVITFKEAVKKYSEDEVSKANGGVLGWQRREQLSLSEEGMKEMDALSVGEISSLYSSPEGVFFYKIEDKLTKGYVPYRVAKQEIRSLIIKNRREEMFGNIIKNLHKISYIKPNVDKFDIEF